MAARDANVGGYRNMEGAQTSIFAAGAGRGMGVRGSATNACYDYQAGNCRRGTSCRFMH